MIEQKMDDQFIKFMDTVISESMSMRDYKYLRSYIKNNLGKIFDVNEKYIEMVSKRRGTEELIFIAASFLIISIILLSMGKESYSSLTANLSIIFSLISLGYQMS